MIRKHTRATALLLGAVAQLAGGFAGAESADTGAQAATATPPPFLARASELLGMPVMDGSSNALGRVAEIVLLPKRNAISYVALSLTQRTDRLYPVTLDQLRLSADRAAFVLVLSSAQQDALPGFRYGYWPESASVAAIAKVAEPVDPELPTPTVMQSPANLNPTFATRLVSGVLGMEMHDPSDQTVCRIRDLIVSVGSGKILTAVVGIDDALGMPEKLASVDWNIVTLTDAPDYARMALTVDNLRPRAWPAPEYWQRAGFNLPAPRQNVSAGQPSQKPQTRDGP